MSPLRFFSFVPLQSPVMLSGLGLVCVAGLVQLALIEGSGRDVVTTLLALQMFSVSTGFAIPARRGHYDSLLTGGASRHAVVGGHLAMSVLPGIAVWGILGLADQILGGHAVWASGSIVALGLVSLGGWAVSAGLPRLSGGVIWLVLLVAGIGWSTIWRQDILAVAGGGGAIGTRALTYLLCPLVAAGRALSAEDFLAILPATVLILSAGALAWRGLVRMNVSLEAAQ